jgi:glycerol-3-phosphate acyltransferase PlsY
MVTLLPIFILLSASFSYLILSLLVLVLVYSKHRENVTRLARGQENPWQRDRFVLNEGS